MIIKSNSQQIEFQVQRMQLDNCTILFNVPKIIQANSIHDVF